MIDLLLSVVFEVTPTPDPEFNPNSVTPGWLGFTAMFLVVVVTVALIFDMARRVRRTRYRAEVQERLEAERQSAEESATPPSED